MSQLKECLELLTRYRDTYLKNNEQEKIYINALLQPAVDTLVPPAVVKTEPKEPLPKKKRKSHYG